MIRAKELHATLKASLASPSRIGRPAKSDKSEGDDAAQRRPSNVQEPFEGAVLRSTVVRRVHHAKKRQASLRAVGPKCLPQGPKKEIIIYRVSFPEIYISN